MRYFYLKPDSNFRDPEPLNYKQLEEIEAKLWHNEIPLESLPIPFRFAKDPSNIDLPVGDILHLNGQILLLNEFSTALLSEYYRYDCVDFPVLSECGKKHHMIFCKDYIEAVDLDASIIERANSGRWKVKKICMDDSMLNGVHFFKIRYAPLRIFVSEMVANIICNNNISGCDLVELEDVVWA